MRARARLLRLFALLATIAALFGARPAAAAQPVVDAIVLVADPTTGAAPRTAETRPRSAGAVATRASARHAAPRPTLPSLQSPRALRARVYVLFCALLR